MNKSNTQKAIVAKVTLGNKEIDGLMLENSSFAITISQVAELFDVSESEVRLIVNGDPWLIVTSEKHPLPTDAINLHYFAKVAYKLSRQGNAKADQLSEVLFGMAMRNLFSDFFPFKPTQNKKRK